MKSVNNKYFVPIAILLFGVLSFILRVLPGYSKVFTNLGVKFSMNDAYYHMRLVDNLVYNFPNFSYYDPYFVYPGTVVVGGAHFFDWLMAAVAWVVGLGTPTQAIIDNIGVFLPPVLATLLVVPVYLLGRALFNRWTGLLAAGLVVILPGEFLGRSIIGAADHHVAETLLSTVAILFFVLACKADTGKKRWTHTLLSGLFMGLYLLTWSGGLLFILILCMFLLFLVITNPIRGISSTHIAVAVSAISLITLLTNYSRTLPVEVLVALLGATIAPLALVALSAIMLKKRLPFWLFPSTLIIGGGLSLGLVNMLYPGFLGYMGMLLPTGSTATTTLELQPLLFPQGQFTTELAWGNFTTTAITAPIALVVLVVSVARAKWGNPARLLLIVWSVVIVLLTLSQRRYAYYAVVNMALLTAYLSWTVVRLTIKQTKPGNRAESRRRLRTARKSGGRESYLRPALATMALLLVLIPSNVVASVKTASLASFAPSDAWQSALFWMKDNTPEPFQGRDIYDNYLPLLAKDLPEWEVFQDILTVEGKQYPEYLTSPTPDYTVSAWWDYGYWITRTAHRVPNANPAQNTAAIVRVARLFLSEGEDYHPLVDELKSRYVILDNATLTGKFYAVASWGDEDIDRYFGNYLVQDGGYKSVMLLYPEYYQTLAVRLYNFDGGAAAGAPIVIEYTEDRVITNAQTFQSYQEAMDYVGGLGTGANARIVSANPFVSPVPLDPLEGYGLVFSSVDTVNGIPEVKVFEYTGLSEKN